MCVCCLYFVLPYHQLKHSNGVCLLLNTAGSIFTWPTLILEAFESCAAPMVSDIARNAKDSFQGKSSHSLQFDLCTANSHLWLDIPSCWLFTLGELLSNFKTQTKTWKCPHPNPTKTTGNLWMSRSGGEKPLLDTFPPHLWWQFHSLHLSPPWDVQSLHGYHQMLAWHFLPWKTWGWRDALPRCQWKVEI